MPFHENIMQVGADGAELSEYRVTLHAQTNVCVRASCREVAWRLAGVALRRAIDHGAQSQTLSTEDRLALEGMSVQVIGTELV
jgi:hypothetical protein